MENNDKKNQSPSGRNSQLGDDDKKDSQEDGYVDDTDFGPGVIKLHPNLVADVDDNSNDDYGNDLDDDEDNE
jgi:hypothetical protein